MRTLAFVTALALGASITGCGGTTQLNADDAVAVATAQANLTAYCAQGTGYNGAYNGVTTLIRIYSKNPKAIYHVPGYPDETMREVLTDTARDLDGCDNQQAMELRDAR